MCGVCVKSSHALQLSKLASCRCSCEKQPCLKLVKLASCRCSCGKQPWLYLFSIMQVFMWKAAMFFLQLVELASCKTVHVNWCADVNGIYVPILFLKKKVVLNIFWLEGYNIWATNMCACQLVIEFHLHLVFVRGRGMLLGCWNLWHEPRGTSCFWSNECENSSKPIR